MALLSDLNELSNTRGTGTSLPGFVVTALGRAPNTGFAAFHFHFSSRGARRASC